MWVPVAVWQPCELLYTCYLLTYLLIPPGAGNASSAGQIEDCARTVSTRHAPGLGAHASRRVTSSGDVRCPGRRRVAPCIHCTLVMLLTFILVSTRIPSPPCSFIPGLKTSISANPSRRSLPFLLQDWLRGFPRLCTGTSEHMRLSLFSFSVLHVLVVGSVR